MHPLTFQVKRAHWAATWFGIREFWRKAEETGIAELGLMTPARFDIMFLIHLRTKEMPEKRYTMMQADITRDLGLERSTVWKTVARMVELGLLTRESAHLTPGRKVIAITELGMRALKAALHVVFTDHRLRTHIEAFVAKFFTGRGKVQGRKKRFRRGPILSWLLGVVEGTRHAVEHFGRDADTIYCVNSLLEL